MSITTKVSRRAENVKGGMKQTAGRLLRGRRRQSAVRRDRAASGARKAGARIRSAFRR
jgi:hypothetical protein